MRSFRRVMGLGGASRPGPSLLLRAAFGTAAVCLLVAGSAAASADRWPAWRGDGSGVAPSSAAPVSWSEEENVAWKTEIPGKGHSSPVVWEDRVFLTTATDGVLKQWAHRVLIVAIWLLAPLAVWWYVENAFHPRIGTPPPAHREPRRRRLVLTALSVALFVGLTVGLALMLRALGKVSLLELPSLGMLLAIGSVSALCVVVVSLARALGEGSVRRTIGGVLGALLPKPREIPEWLTRYLVIVICGTFFAALFLYTLGTEFERLPRLIWPKTTTVCALGLLAAFGALSRRSKWRMLAPIAAAALVLLVLANVPLPGTWQGMVEKKSVMVSLLATLLLGGWFALETFLARRPRAAAAPATADRRSGWGPLLTIFLVVSYFLTNNVIHAKAYVSLNGVCLRESTGEILWMKRLGTRSLDKMSWRNTAATPTPVTDGERVYFDFGSGGTSSLDFEGKIQWQRGDPDAVIQYGPASSPLLWRDLLLLTRDTDEHSVTIALDKRTGDERWRSVRDLDPGVPLDGYSTPLVVEFGGRHLLVSNSTTYAAGIDLQTGEEIWHLEHAGKQNIVSPITWRDLIIMVGGPSHGPRFMGALRLDERDGKVEARLAWEAERNRPGVSSPVVVGDHLYTVTENGIVSCLEAASGELVWRKRLPSSLYEASLVAAGRKIYASNTEGATFVLEAGTEPVILSENLLEGGFYASPAITDGKIFLRSESHLYCIRDS